MASRPPWTFGMKGFYPAVEHLGESRQIRDIPHLQALLAEEFRRAAGGEQLNFQRHKPGGQFKNAGLVADADQRPGNFAHGTPLEGVRSQSQSDSSLPRPNGTAI